MILDKIVEDVRNRLAETKRNCSLAEVKKAAFANEHERESFFAALQKHGISVIAEVKKGSPSKGVIAHEFPYLQIAKEYEAAGASAVSVLTEQDHFFGSVNYLSEIKRHIHIPVLRKDFMVDEYQIYEAAAIGADAILLIAAILDSAQIVEFMAVAKEFDMDCLVETHDEAEMEKALAADARIIGINNRDLKTFDVDLRKTLCLRKLVPADKIVVSESGIKDNLDMQLLGGEGIDAVLIGETFMRASDKVLAFRELMGE